MHILTTILCIGAVVCADDIIKKLESAGRNYKNQAFKNRFPGILNNFSRTFPQEREHIEHHEEDDDHHYDEDLMENSHGYVITAPPEHHNVPPPFVQNPPSSRVISPQMGSGRGFGVIYGGIYNFGKRQGMDMDRLGHQSVHGHAIGYAPSDEIVHPDEDPLDVHGDDGSIDSETCTIVCESWEFLCSKSCQCIRNDARCDGNIDCLSEEDEIGCEEANEDMIRKLKSDCETSQDHIMCPRTLKCIARKWLCDGDDDCGDFSDETGCGESNKCSEDQFECLNGLCIQQSWYCDGDNDCKDFSDEMNCPKLPCTPQEFSCADGSCVSLSFRCDGDPDCSDGTDELTCDSQIPNCAEGEFKCKNSLDSSRGPGNSCILQRFRCDGDNDCGDWSDEEGCPKKPSSCVTNEFKCDDGTCIPERWRCDREQDCDGGEDEKNCGEAGKDGARTCAPDEYTCKDGRCILKSWVCDGVADCKRGEDELECEVHCEIGQFSCPIHKNSTVPKICVNQKHICDGHNDCPAAEDEKNCPTHRECGTNSKCEQMCITSFNGREDCACRNGFSIHSNGYNCTDIDECQFTTDPVCSQNCINTVGSFRCACTLGYILRPDLRTCKALGGAVKLIMANRADIRQVTLSNNKYTSILKGLHNAIALDYHHNRDLIFWSDVSTDVIKKAFINGTGIKDIVKWGLESPGGVAVDWVHDLLFWTDSGTRRVEVATYDGQLRAVIAANDLDKPRAIVVHPGEAMVFWTDWGPNPKIERGYMDGSERKTIIKEGVFWPNGLAIDYPANRLYWADAKHHVIESAHLDGSDRKKVLSNHLPHPFALTIFEDALYWTDWHTKSISTANKNTGKGFRTVHEGLHFPMDIHSFHPARQPEFRNRCVVDRRGLKGGCSHLCLPNKNSRRCGCPIGLTLKGDQKTCTTVPDNILLVVRKKDIRLRQLNPTNSSAEVDMVIPLDGLKSTVALDWCSRTDYIYWTDVGRGAISKAYLNGSNQEIVIQANLVSPAGLALDWVTNKIYWTDQGTKRIEVASTNGKQRALLIWQRLEKPRDIVVNPIDGLMFWSDWGPPAVIERAGMDGSQRRVLVSKNLQWPNGLSVDGKKNRLYFVDGGTKTLEYINFDGTGRTKFISTGLQHPFGLDIYGSNVYWTDWESNSVEVADKISGKHRKTIISNTNDLMDIRVFHRERRNVQNPCSLNNGGCSDICLLNSQSYTCACSVGVKLTSDHKTCNDGPSSYIVIAHRIDIRQISLDIDYLVDVVMPFPPMANAVAIGIDHKTGDIYWSDTIEDIIVKSSADGHDVEQIVSESLDIVDGLLVDSIGRKIYWSDAGRHTIEVSELDGRFRNILVSQELDAPRGIAISYKYGYLFWSDWGSYPKIERSEMDGEKRTKIVTSNVVWPNGLSIDNSEKRIYWTDAELHQISSCDFDGNSKKVILTKLLHPYGLAVSKTTLYWTDWKTSSVHSVEKNDLEKINVVKNNLEILMDIEIVEENDSTEVNACGDNNGGCSHLCLRKPTGFSCKCPTGTKLKEGSSKECELLPKDFLLIALRLGIGQISLDSKEFFDVVLPIEGIHGAVVLDYHLNDSKIFYADVNLDVIRSVDMKTTNKTKTLVSTGLHTPNGLAIDWVANNMYWTDTGLKIMEVSRIDGSSRKVIIQDGLSDPRAMILYPKEGYIFWSDWGQPPKIERCLMDGSQRKTIIDVHLGYPNGLAIDFEAKRIYWADALEDRIDMADFNGNNRVQVVQRATHPFGVTLFGAYVYWTDWYNKSVFRALKTGNSTPEEVRHNIRAALEIRSVGIERQPNDWNPCAQENGGCSHLCLFKRDSYICGCPDKIDNRTCKIEPAFKISVKPPMNYSDRNDKHPNSLSKNSEEQKLKEQKEQFEFIIVATIVMATILIVVLTIIIVLVVMSRKKGSNKAERGSSRFVLTFSNPNYNGVDGQPQESAPKNSIWKRLKYDKAQERVYEEKCLGDSSEIEIVSTCLNAPSCSSNLMPLSTIG